MRIEIVPCLRDNYAYLLVDDARHEAVAIDPSEGAPVEAALAAHGLALAAIWCTHHHWDHVGGVAALAATRPAIPVVAGAHDAREKRIAGQTQVAGDDLSFGGEPVRVLSVPGHTLGATAYLVGDALFTGDTLFLAGCGRVFEGTMAQMLASLELLASLEPATRVYCGHEYTERNLEFAATIDPDSAAVARRLADVRARRSRGEPTVPATLAEEQATNPFLRTRGPGRDPLRVFTALRTAKDAF